MAGKLTRRAYRMLAVGRELAGKAWARALGSSGGAGRAMPAAPPPAAGAGIETQVVVITGGTRGVGRALAEGLAALGARVAILGRDGAEAERIAAAIGDTAMGLGADVTDAGALSAAMDRVVERFGRIDTLINNAGVTGPLDTPGWEIPGDEFDRVLHVNVTGAQQGAAEAIRRMRDAGTGGRIINVSSGAVDRTQAGMGAYSLSKHALEGLTRQLALDVAGDGIGVASIRLGSLHTEMTEKAFGKVQASLLPEPASVVPAFRALAEAPVPVIRGRSFAAWRLLADPAGELAAPTPMAQNRNVGYPDYVHNGRVVARGDPDFRVYDRAENPFGPSPRVIRALTEEVQTRPLAVYPDAGHRPLLAALSESLGLDQAGIAIGNGSWELLDRLLELFVLPGEEVVCAKPGWFGFNMLCDKRGIVANKVLLDRSKGRAAYDLDAMAAAVGPATRLVYLISPSNPEGIVLKRDATLAFLDSLPEGLPVLFDEAYAEFCGDPDAFTALDAIGRSERPIFGLRTFSKFHSLAAMRVGYAYARPEWGGLLNRAERIFNISHLSEVAAVAALGDTEHQKMVYDETVRERARIYEAFEALGLDYIPSEAPYVLVELPGTLKSVVETFAAEGVFLGEKAFFRNKYIMFPVARAEDNTRNLALLKSCR